LRSPGLDVNDIRVNVQFVCGEIIQMQRIRERNYTVKKQSLNGNSKAKKLTKTIQFIEVIRHN